MQLPKDYSVDLFVVVEWLMVVLGGRTIALIKKDVNDCMLYLEKEHYEKNSKDCACFVSDAGVQHVT